MAPIDLGSYKSIYLKTAREYIASLLTNCSKLVSDSQNKDVLNQIHIASHSLKSQSQVMGFTDVSNACLNIEKMSDDALKGNTQLNNQTISDIKKSVGKLEEILRSAMQNSG
jgi:chemotaxis protein histidine kinase CheA